MNYLPGAAVIAAVSEKMQDSKLNSAVDPTMSPKWLCSVKLDAQQLAHSDQRPWKRHLIKCILVADMHPRATTI